MSMISKLCSDLRNAADEGYCPNRDRILMRNAADTIEALSEKVREQNLTHTYESMSDSISRQEVLSLIENTPYNWSNITERTVMLRKIRAFPSADRPPKVVAQIIFDEEKLREIVKEAIERFKEEYKITDRPTGKWIDREYCQVDEDSYEVAICSKCGAEVTIEYPYDSYCPNCGTKMEV